MAKWSAVPARPAGSRSTPSWKGEAPATAGVERAAGASRVVQSRSSGAGRPEPVVRSRRGRRCRTTIRGAHGVRGAWSWSSRSYSARSMRALFWPPGAGCGTAAPGGRRPRPARSRRVGAGRRRRAACPRTCGHRRRPRGWARTAAARPVRSRRAAALPDRSTPGPVRPIMRPIRAPVRSGHRSDPGGRETGKRPAGGFLARRPGKTMTGGYPGARSQGVPAAAAGRT